MGDSTAVTSFPRSGVGTQVLALQRRVFREIQACMGKLIWGGPRFRDAGASRDAFPRRSVGTMSNPASAGHKNTIIKVVIAK